MQTLRETTNIKQETYKCLGSLYVRSPNSGPSVNATPREKASYDSPALCPQWLYGRNPYCGQTGLRVEQFLSCCSKHGLLFYAL